MKPLTVVTGIILGCATSIFVGLAVVLLLFFIIGRDDPRIADQFVPLVQSTLVFMVLTGASFWSFLGLVKQRPWRRWAQLVMWAVLVGLVLFMKRLMGL